MPLTYFELIPNKLDSKFTNVYILITINLKDSKALKHSFLKF